MRGAASTIGLPDVLRRVEIVQPIARVRAGGMPDLRGELDAGRARADDDDVHPRGSPCAGLGVRPHAGGEQAAMEAFGVSKGVERNGVRRDTRDIEVVADAADAEYQRVIAQHAARQHEQAVVVEDRIERQFMLRPVEAGHRALAKAEVMPIRQRKIVDPMHISVHPPRRDLVQQRLPQMRSETVDQGNFGAAVLSELVAQPHGQRQAAGAAADNDDAVPRRLRRVHEGQSLAGRGGAPNSRMRMAWALSA